VGMDSQLTATREEIYHVQMDVKHVQAVQINHADRLLRLEKRLADDAALKSVWGTSSPFPGVLSGAPQQGQSQSGGLHGTAMLIGYWHDRPHTTSFDRRF
jgi:hypothetical protein